MVNKSSSIFLSPLMVIFLKSNCDLPAQNALPIDVFDINMLEESHISKDDKPILIPS